VTAVRIPRSATAARRLAWPVTAPVATAALVVVAITARFSAIGADARWLAALGRVIAQSHSVPSGVPFAAAPSAHFPNVLALAELIFYGLEHAFGDRGLMLAQALAVAIAMVVLGRDARAAGARNGGIAVALAIAAVGALPSLAIVRVQLFSVALFPVLIALLRSEARMPSRRIWLAVPLLALWGNLHAAVLVGFAVLCCYLAFSRFRAQRLSAVGVAVAGAVALGLNPALAGSFDYYHRGLTNVSVQRGFGYWAPLSLTSAFDIVLVLAALALALGLRRFRPPTWELVAIVALVVATIDGSRDGVWLLFFLVATGAHAFTTKRSWRPLMLPIATLSVAIIAFSVAAGPVRSGVSGHIIARALAIAHGTPILAPDVDAEQIALAGGRVWLSNPLEAFSDHDQAAYIDWLQGRASGRGALAGGVDVALVGRGDDTARLMARTPGFRVAFSDGQTVLYERASR
jgi:hypothetical protein